MKITLEEFDKDFLELSWIWLNDNEIKSLTNSKEITKVQQWEWFTSLPDREDYRIWGILADFIPIGACGLKNITDVDCEYWGYIGVKNYWGKGIGKEMLFLLEEKARGIEKISIWLQVLKENTRAFFLYKNHGYIVEDETESLFVMRKEI